MFDGKMHCYDFGKYRLDVTNNQLLRDKAPVSITQKSYDVLRFFIENRGRVLKKEELLDVLWEEDFVEDSTLTQHIYMLRKALKQNGTGDIYIETIPKIGYRFIAEVREIILAEPIKAPAIKHIYPDSQETLTDLANTDIAHFKSLTESGKVTAYVQQVNKAKHGGKFPLTTVIILGITALIIISVLGYSYFYNGGFSNSPPIESNSGEIKRIAVLPFNQINDEKDEKLGLGLADVLISKLSNLENISVLPTSTIIALTDQDNEDLFELGKKLKVDAILAGSIQRDGDVFRVNLQLYSIRNQRPIFTDKFDVEDKNIFLIQDRIAEQVANKLSLKMNVGNKSLPFTEFTSSIEAYQYYSIGLFHWKKRTKESLLKSIEYFGMAIEKDPQFVHAYAYLADSYVLFAYYGFKEIPRNEALSKAKKMAQLALDFDQNCSPALTALATVYMMEDKEEEGVKLLKKAIERDPNNSTARVRIAWSYVYEENLDKAIDEMKMAQVLDPLSIISNLALAQILNLARRPDESITYSRLALEIDPASIKAKSWIADSLEQKGMFIEAIEEQNKILNVDKNNSAASLALSRIYAKQGKSVESEKILNEILKREVDEEDFYSIALNYIALGKKEEAFKYLKLYQKNRGSYPAILHDYQLDPIRKIPEFENLMRSSE